MNKAPERIILGSGYLHLAKFKKGMTIPEPQNFCTDENCYSYIKNGASMEYTNEVQEAKDDMGKVSKTIITSEEAVLKAGLMTLTGNTIEKLCDTARVEEKDGYRITKIGGIGNRRGDKYVICFHHPDPTDGDIYVMIIGQNQAGFTLSFAPSDATVVDAEFKAAPNLDGEGTLIKYVEEIPAAPEPEIYTVTQELTNVASSYSGETVTEGTTFETNLTPIAGYALQNPTITMGGIDVSASAWNGTTRKITIENVIGNITIEAAATVITHSITQELTNVSSSLTETTINETEALEAEITPATGYEIGTVTVTMGGVDITATAWDSETGKVTISSVTGDVVITATAS